MVRVLSVNKHGRITAMELTGVKTPTKLVELAVRQWRKYNDAVDDGTRK